MSNAWVEGLKRLAQDAVNPPKPAPVFDRAAFLKRQGLAAPTAIGPDDSAAIGNALRFGK